MQWDILPLVTDLSAPHGSGTNAVAKRNRNRFTRRGLYNCGASLCFPIPLLCTAPLSSILSSRSSSPSTPCAQRWPERSAPQKRPLVVRRRRSRRVSVG
jgi:hypothetical protein